MLFLISEGEALLVLDDVCHPCELYPARRLLDRKIQLKVLEQEFLVPLLVNNVMNYLSIYDSIINRAQSENRRRKSKIDKTYIYYESHHIIPKCLGGTNDKNNLVLLTAREHFLAHQLLVKIYPNRYKLIFALRMMTASSTKHVRNNKEYEWIRKLVSKTSSKSQKGKSYGNKFQKGHVLSKGKDNGMYGKNHTNETKKIQSEKAKNRDPVLYDFARLPKTDLHKENISKSKRTRKFKLINPAGTEYIVDTTYEASNISGISNSVLVKLAGNRYGFDNCRNWKISAIPL